LIPRDFSGGETTVERKLNDLGFEVVRVGEAWTAEEVQLTVADYIEMLTMESKGASYNKVAHNAELRKQLRTRSKAAVELKHQNISAVMDELGLPRIDGYKPRGNVQHLLREVVTEAVRARQTELLKVVELLQNARFPSETNYAAVLVDAPVVLPPKTAKSARLPRKLDYAARDEQNRELGKLGEKWVLGYETFRLSDLQRADLAKRIDWASDSQGDGLGYDIASFEEDEEQRFIEVKTTNGDAATPFVVSRNEVEFSSEAGPAYFLYRVFQFRTSPLLFTLQGSLTDSVALSPLDYRARLKAV
jgi:hypothetical protein